MTCMTGGNSPLPVEGQRERERKKERVRELAIGQLQRAPFPEAPVLAGRKDACPG